jgi:hypothetical protein
MNKQEYCDHPEKLMGYQEFQGMGKGDGEAVEPDWLIENKRRAVLKEYGFTDNQ